MTRVIHHWPTRRIVIAVAAVIALPKSKTIPRMRKEIPFTGRFEIGMLETSKARCAQAFDVSGSEQ
jgi:hypothetical protein